MNKIKTATKVWQHQSTKNIQGTMCGSAKLEVQTGPGAFAPWGFLSHLTPDSYRACPERLWK